MAVSATARHVVDFDPLRDKSYRETRLGPDVVDWLAWLELGGAAPRTLDQYERDLAKTCLMFPSKGLADFTDGDLAHVIRSWPKPSRPFRKASLESFFRFAIKTRRLEKNPMQLLPVIKRSGQKVYDIFTEAEIDDLRMLSVVDVALVDLLVEGGLRKSEATALQVRRLKLEPAPGEVVILGGKGNKDRVVPMSTQLARSVRELLYLEALDSHDFLWYTRPGGGKLRRDRPLGDGSFDRWWKRCVRDAGVRYRNPHMARHTFATRWLRRGGRLETLSKVMGHASIRTTYDLYAHLDTRDVAADLAIIEEYGGPA